MSEEIRKSIHESVAAAIEGATIRVDGGGGHYTIEVVSNAFEGKNRVQKQRMVLSAITHLMKGEGAPVHAVDKITTLTEG